MTSIQRLGTHASLAACLALVSLAACKPSSDSARVDGQRTAETARTSDDSNARQEIPQQPGEIGKVETGKGSADVTTARKVIEVEKGRESIPTVKTTHHKADINRMDRDDFMALGLTKESAENILKYRREHGDFRSTEDLRQVPGLNSAWLNQMRDKLAISSG